MEKVTIAGRVYRQLDACSVGDYGGDSSVGAANIRSLLEQFSSCRLPYSRINSQGELTSIYHKGCWIADPMDADFDLLILYGSYGSESAYLAEDAEGYDDIVASLTDYPCLDDEAMSEIELEWTDAAITDCVRDVGRSIRSIDEAAEEIWGALDQEQAEQLIRDAMEATNTYAHIEHSSAYISADDIAPWIAEKLASLPIVRAVKLSDGSLVSLGEEYNEETPDQYGRTESMFNGLPNDTSAYVAEIDKRLNHKAQ